eukprot:GHUV01045292.1.p1 GENE.GHUV01045292.1~~GHUV01045292.1.p1  ORF type:complete len:151 (+),score=19.79 GHUV01045292.1:64-516(+)
MCKRSLSKWIPLTQRKYYTLPTQWASVINFLFHSRAVYICSCSQQQLSRLCTAPSDRCMQCCTASSASSRHVSIMLQQQLHRGQIQVLCGDLWVQQAGGGGAHHHPDWEHDKSDCRRIMQEPETHLSAQHTLVAVLCRSILRSDHQTTAD